MRTLAIPKVMLGRTTSGRPKAKRLRRVFCTGSEGIYSSEGPGTKDFNNGGSKGFIGIQFPNQVRAKGRREYKLANLGEGGREQGERDQWGIEEQSHESE